ncbi:hypothetical protein LZC95_08030 [Pendulispora brunnea]|uniref:Uncharacterized protein n=1 Tax=Pendulispora brunnea TaxID=2905690 RepID=A0ABZ2KDS0_9BACT
MGARLQAEGDDVAFVFDEGVVVLPYLVHSNHYRRGVQHGALVAADEETARRCGVPFRDPSEILAAARADAIARWTAERPDETPAIARMDQADSGETAAVQAPPSEAAGGEHAVGDAPANGAS